MEENKLQEDMVLAGVHLQEEDFEQVEEYLWEEYFEKTEVETDSNPERSLIKQRMEQTITVLMTFVVTNAFYVLILFLAWYIPAGFLYGCSIFEGAFIMTIVGGTLSIAWYDENNGVMQSLLTYFPVNAKRLRMEMYAVVWKYFGIQVLITCIPMILMAIGFVPERFFITLICNIAGMLVVSTLFVEGSMHMMKAEA